MESRTEKASKNVSASLVTQIVGVLLSIVNRTVFIKILGAEYLGVNGLYTSVLSILSFAELGFGNALAFSLYKPLSEGNHEKVAALMQWFKRVYNIIALSIFLLGIFMIPILPFVINETPNVEENLTIIYLIFLVNSVVSYLCIYKSTLITADQNNYIVQIVQTIFKVISVVFQIVFLVITRKYMMYLIVNIMFQVISNIFISRLADRLYPYIKKGKSYNIDVSEKNSIFTNIKALFLYKIAGIAIDSTDNIFISTFINVATVGIYSNYTLIISILNSLISQALQSVMSSVGNLVADNTKSKKTLSIFNELFMFGAVLTGLFTVGIYLCVNDVLILWIGDSYLLSKNVLMGICGMFYLSTLHLPVYIYRTAGGAFQDGWYVPLVAAPVNIILDILLGSHFGLVGIFGATIITRIATYEIWDPYFVFKKIFKSSPKPYFLEYSIYLVYTMAVAGMLDYISSCFITKVTFGSLFLKTIIIIVIYGITFFAFFGRTVAFNQLKARFFRIIKSKII